MTAKIQYPGEKKIYAREFHTVSDKNTFLAYDVENTRIIKLNALELRVLKNIKVKPASVPGLKKRLSAESGGKVEEAVNELIRIDMLGYSPFKKISRGEINDYESNYLDKLKNKNFKQIALNVTHKCNLNCDYCYGGDGSYGGPAVNMDKKTARRAVDFLMEQSGNSDLCRITLFGGEPLLNFHLVKFVVKYAKKEALKRNKKMLFGMTTNGILLDEDNSDFLIKENIEVTFSLDGPKSIHDKSRKFKSNKEKSSFDLIYPKILKYIEKAEKHNSFYAFRATVTRPGIRDIYNVVEFLKSFKTGRIIFDLAEYKKGVSPGGLAITKDDLGLYRQKVKELAAKFKEDKLKSGYSLFSNPLAAMKRKEKKQSSCGSPGALYVGVSAAGDIFPCHRFVGYKETKLGNIWEGFNREKWLKKYAGVHIFNSRVCSKCWIRYFCGGLCPANNYFLNGDMVLYEDVEPEPVHCQIKKIVFEESMLLFASLDEMDSQAEQH